MKNNKYSSFEQVSFHYALESFRVTNKRDFVLEDRFFKNPEYAYRYARDIIKGRWTKAEKYIVENFEYSYCYARDIIKDRWPEAESTIMKSPYYAYLYARYIIEDRWPEAESIIFNNYWGKEYKKFVDSLKIKDEKFFDDPINQFGFINKFNYVVNKCDIFHLSKDENYFQLVIVIFNLNTQIFVGSLETVFSKAERYINENLDNI